MCVIVCVCLECFEATVRTPARCREVNVSHLYDNREPLNLRHHITCHEEVTEVLQVEVVLTPPLDTEWSSVRLELGTLDNNNTPLG